MYPGVDVSLSDEVADVAGPSLVLGRGSHHGDIVLARVSEGRPKSTSPPGAHSSLNCHSTLPVRSPEEACWVS